MRLFCSLLLGALFVLASADARADDATEALIKEGVELRRTGKESEALEKFKEAHAREPSARAQAQIGLASKSLRLYVDAERALLAALAAVDDPWVKQNRPALELARDVVAKQLATLVVHSNVSAASVVVNGAKLTVEEPLRVLAGVAHVELRAPGHLPTQTDANLPAGETTELNLVLVPEEAPPPPPRSPSPPPLAPTADVPPPPKGTGKRIATYSAAGIGVIGLGVGTIFGVRTLDAKSQRDALCNASTCASEEGVRLDEDARSAATISTIGFVVGVAAIATAAVLFLMSR